MTAEKYLEKLAKENPDNWWSISTTELMEGYANEKSKADQKACLERAADKVSYLDIHNMELVLDTITDEANLI
jgi:outer membrane protein assembly factor BamD (BamD/ComL family)